MKCGSVHSIPGELVFLDLHVELKTPMASVCASQVKPVTPLCPTSAHSMNVHKGWPSTVKDRIVRLAASESCKSEGVSVLCSRYQMANTHPFTMQILRRNKEIRKKPTQDVPVANLVLRYHPIFRLAATIVLALVPFPVAEYGFGLRCGWTNALPSLESLIQRHNKIWEAASHG